MCTLCGDINTLSCFASASLSAREIAASIAAPSDASDSGMGTAARTNHDVEREFEQLRHAPESIVRRFRNERSVANQLQSHQTAKVRTKEDAAAKVQLMHAPQHCCSLLGAVHPRGSIATGEREPASAGHA